ncbi:uncharacterized protein LOC124113922 [Haliotis rufescens]|uniref:uncharacterized protein LOC124113922 n=1 Tax=Haliotis rufescens TaxID=6454 RepID=UPI00201F8498|nr:uncharacterized protein LOC124113922 [Haliotis rufescens]
MTDNVALCSSIGRYLDPSRPWLTQLSALATQAKEGASAILKSDAQSGTMKSTSYFIISDEGEMCDIRAGMPRSDTIAMSRSTLVKVSSLAMHSEEEGTLCQYGSLKSEDDFIMIDIGDQIENQQPLTVERASINTSMCIDSVQPLTSSVEAQDKRNDTGQSSHPIPLSPIQQLLLQDRDTARQTLCNQLETKGFKATFRFQQREVDIEVESKEAKKQVEALDVITSSVVEMELTFSSDELEQMAQVADIQHVLVPLLSRDQDVLVVIDKTNGGMKLVGMADTINLLKETLNKLQELSDCRHKKNQEKQGSPKTSTSISIWPRESSQEQALLYQSSNLLESRTVKSRRRAQSALPKTQDDRSCGFPEDQDVKVTVVFNRIEKQNADVIVNTTNRQLNLSSGFGVSYSLLKAAGSDIQTCLRHTYPNGIDHGDLAVGRSGNLDTCKKIYHGCLPFYKGFRKTSTLSKCYERLVSLVFRCLIQACKDGFQTIALPAFGTGALQYPNKNVVQLMYHTIDLVTQENRQKSLKEIFIVTSLESRLDVKQLFLAHRITHKLKTRWLEAPPEDRHGFFYNLFRPRTDSSLPVFLEREVRRPVQTKCELRIMIADTLVQIINGGISEVCDVTQTSLLLWRERDTRTRTSGVVDPSTSVPGRIIRAYDEDDSEDNNEDNNEAKVRESMLIGLRLAAEKEWYHVTIPLSAEDVLSPDQITAAIVAAIKRRSCGVYVLTLAVPDTNIYIDVATRIARHGIVQEPPDVSNVSLVDSLWKAKFSRQRFESLGETCTTEVVVTSDSEETNTNAARDVERELHVELDVV